MPEHSRWVGRVLRDKWRIDGRVARGGVGTVYAATHRNNGNKVAIKVLHPEFSRDEDTRSRFLQEGYAANQVNHPGVVRILDDDVLDDGSAFLVMELLEGELLESRRVRKGGRLDLGEVYDMADQLLDVLAAAHDKGIVHRDIKPDNLFITHENRLKVLDFGFAQMKTGFRKEQTAAGFLLGTPGFMSPEQAVGNRDQVDAQTDIWAVGATLFTCLSGEPVHDAESAAEMLVAAANFPCRSLATLEPHLPPYLVNVVDRALAFDKNERWPNARSMQLALRSVPGRATNRGMFESGRRAVPGDGRADGIEELDPIDVVETHAADDDGPTIAGSSPLSEGAPLTPHMADRPFDIASVGPPRARMQSGFVQPLDDNGTLIMEGSPNLAPGRPRPSPVYPIPPTGYSSTSPAGFPQTPVDAMVSTGPHQPILNPQRQSGHEFMYAPASYPPATPPRSGSRALVLVGVAIVSMIIVVVTGLLVLAASD